MKKYRKHLTSFVLIALIIMGGFLIYRSRVQKLYTPSVPEPFDTSQIELEIISEVDGFEAAGGVPVRRNLVDLLNTIHFWDQGVRHEGVVDNQGGIPKQFIIKLSSEPQVNYKQLIKEGNEIIELFSNSFTFENGRGVLIIYANERYATADTIKVYLLNSLYHLSFWTLNQNELDSVSYNNAQSNFVQSADFMINWFEPTQQ